MAILYPLSLPLANPKVQATTVASLASGSSSVLECLNITESKTAKLLCILVTSSVAFKADLRLIEDGVQSGSKAIWHAADGTWDFKPIDSVFFNVTGNSVADQNGYRIIVTNLGIDVADVSAVFYYDEE